MQHVYHGHLKHLEPVEHFDVVKKNKKTFELEEKQEQILTLMS